MKKTKTYIYLILLTITSCSSYLTKKTGTTNVLDQNLKWALSNQKKTQHEEKNILLFSDNKYANNCHSYWKLLKNHTILESTKNFIIKAEYLICNSIWAISKFGLYKNKLNDQFIGEILLNHLDFREFRSSIHKLTKNRLFTLKNIFPKEARAIKNQVVYETESWLLTLKVVAITKASNTKSQNWIVQMVDQAKQGTYEVYSTLIINKPNNSHKLKVIRKL